MRTEDTAMIDDDDQPTYYNTTTVTVSALISN